METTNTTLQTNRSIQARQTIEQGKRSWIMPEIILIDKNDVLGGSSPNQNETSSPNVGQGS